MFRTPRDIETNFRKSLGSINPLMCMADIAAHELVNKGKDELPVLTKKYKHNRLNTKNINLPEISIYINLAHIAYINGRAEAFCSDIVSLSKEYYEDSKNHNIDSMDFLRRTIVLLHARKNNTNNTKISESIYMNYVGDKELLIIDYYRGLRNVELHGGKEKEHYITENEKILNEINDKYNFLPNKPSAITIRDVILFSQAWQIAAKKICGNSINIDDVLLEKICKKYINHPDTRKRNAIRQTLRQDYLQSEDTIDMLESKGWLA